MFRIFRFFFTVTMMGVFWLFGLIAGVFLGAMLMSRQGQMSWQRIQSFGRRVVDLAREEIAGGGGYADMETSANVHMADYLPAER